MGAVSIDLKLIVLSILIFLTLSNNISSFPVDKISYVLILIWFAFFWFYSNKNIFKINHKYLIIIFIICKLMLVYLFFLSLMVSDYQKTDALTFVFYFTVSLLLIAMGRQNSAEILLKSIVIGSLLHVITGIYFYVYSFFSGDIINVVTRSDKGLNDSFAATGYSTTPQVYASICMLVFIILNKSIWLKGSKLLLYGIYLICFLGLILSFNRTWIIYFIILTLIGAWGGARNKILILFLFLPTSFTYFSFNEAIFDFSTIISRISLFFGAFEFWYTSDMFSKLFGSPYYSEPIFTINNHHFYYIENNVMFLLIKFGIFFFLIFLIFQYVLMKTIEKKGLDVAPVFYFYFFFVQMITQEYLASIFWIYVVALLAMADVKSRKFLNRN